VWRRRVEPDNDAMIWLRFISSAPQQLLLPIHFVADRVKQTAD
jgi:hypothetical protein